MMANPRTVLLPRVNLNPSTPAPAPEPQSLTFIKPLNAVADEFVAAPGWVYPSIATGSLTSGSAEAGEIVVARFVMAKEIVSPALIAAFASRIAWRKEPGPESLVLTTV